jgi:hypothetical protein
MAARLPLDAHVAGYFGFDEANPTDPAIDESTNASDLVVVGSPSVTPARAGNGRQFDGATNYAYGTSRTPFANWHYGTIIVWATLDDVNQAGDKLRPIIALDGPGAAGTDATVFYLGVLNTGAVVFRYDAAGPLPIVLASAPGTIRVGRYYSYAVTVDTVQDPDAVDFGNAVVKLYLNHLPVPWAAFTAGGGDLGAPSSLPPVPAVGANVRLTVGGSQKSASLWHGVIDELSIHDTARAAQPYLDAAYFRLTLGARMTRLTAHGNVKSFGGADMGGGTRWWVYERDSDLYAIRENSLGLFSAEIQLTTAGTAAAGGLRPAGAHDPRLAYDPASDTLLIAFIASGRVYKITAASGDSPVTANMPGTQDTSGILKTLDPIEVGRFALDGPALDLGCGDLKLRPTTVVFITVPAFGVAAGSAPLNPGGYLVTRTVGGAETVVGEIPAGNGRTSVESLYVFVPVPERTPGAIYTVYPVDPTTGLPSIEKGATAIDVDPGVVEAPAKLTWNAYGEADDGWNSAQLGLGDTTDALLDAVGYVNRGVLKMPVDDAVSMLEVAGGTITALLEEIGFVNRGVLKMQGDDSFPTIGGATGAGTGVVTMSTPIFSPASVGQMVLLTGFGVDSGTYVVSAVIDATHAVLQTVGGAPVVFVGAAGGGVTTTTSQSFSVDGGQLITMQRTVGGGAGAFVGG